MANFQIIRDSQANLEASNPVLAPNQLAVFLDVRNGVPTGTNQAKLGDGRSRFNDLEYWNPQGYLVYTALLTQTGTDAPVATVLENTLGGTVVWTYDDIGLYQGTLTDAFTENKTWISPVNASVTLDGATTFNIAVSFWVDADRIRVQTAVIDAAGGSQTNADNCLIDSSIEINIWEKLLLLKNPNSPRSTSIR